MTPELGSPGRGHRSFEGGGPPLRGAVVGGAHGILRIMAGLLFMQHGSQKLFGWMGGFGPQNGTAEFISIFGLAGVLEFWGGLLIVLGLLTRPVALVLFLEMMIAYFWRHQPNALWPIENRGELALLFGFIWLYLAAAGPGRWSLDGLLRGRRGRRAEAAS